MLEPFELTARRAASRLRGPLAAIALLIACGEDKTSDDPGAATGDPADAGAMGGADARADPTADASSASDASGSTSDARITTGPSDASTPAPGSDGGAATRPTSCNGKPLPPRALGKAPPYAIGPEAFGLPGYWPTDGFRMETPEKLGFDAQKLMAAVDYKTATSNSQAVLVIRHGYVAAEKYFGGFTVDRQQESYSMAKSFVSALVGIAIEEKKLSGLDEKVCASYPMQWNCADTNDARSRITVDHAMNLTTGLMWSEDWKSTGFGKPNDAITSGMNMLDTVLARPATMEPGSNRRYSTADPSLLSGVLQRATGMTVLEYAQQKLFSVLGISNARWNADSKGRTTSYAGLQATARDYAKFGYLYLQRGKWGDKQVVPAQWVDFTTQPKDYCNDWNQYLWHVNPPVRLGTQDPSCGSLFCQPTEFADLPSDAFMAMGVTGQFIFVIPSADIVVVRLAMDGWGSENWDAYAKGFLTALLASVKD